MCSEIRRNPPDISKGIFANVISRFESWHPSGPLSPLLPVSGLLENERLFRALDWRKRVSGAKHLALLGSQCAFLHASLQSRFFNIQNLLLETWFEVTGDCLQWSQLRLGGGVPANVCCLIAIWRC